MPQGWDLGVKNFSMVICNGTPSTAHSSFTVALVFSSPEPKAHGELIVYQSPERPSVRGLSSVIRPSTISNIFSSETTGPIRLKLHKETP